MNQSRNMFTTKQNQLPNIPSQIVSEMLHLVYVSSFILRSVRLRPLAKTILTQPVTSYGVNSKLFALALRHLYEVLKI